MDPNLVRDLAADTFFTQADWCLVVRKPECILPVRNQGRTDTCYAHAVTAVMYGDEIAHGRSSTVGSTQEFLDYMHQFKRPTSVDPGPYIVPDKGFSSSLNSAFTYVEELGLSPARIYPWVGSVTTSRRIDDDENGFWDRVVSVNGHHILENEKISITGFRELFSKEEIERTLREQPVTGVFYAPVRTFINWHSKEILKRCGNTNELRHAITIVGYGREGSNNYYICQNSFGVEWGHKGYFKMLRHLIGDHLSRSALEVLEIDGVM